MSMLLGTWRGLLDRRDFWFYPSDVPLGEAAALLRFYNATGGPAWTADVGWGTDPVVNNWQGVTVVGGHVTQLVLNANNLIGSGDNELAPLAASLTNLALQTNGGLIIANINSLTAIATCTVQDMGWAQAIVDAFLLGMYTNRAAYTDATPALNIGGTNAAPGGVYAYAAVPSTGNEYRYALVNDDDAEGFNTWTITV